MGKKKTGRPTIRTPEAIARILEGLSNGTPLTVLCAPDDMPSTRAIYSWMEKDADLSADIARARDAGYDAIAFRIRATVRGKTEAEGGDSTGDVQRDKLIADTDLKLLAKWDPRRYGDKVDHTSSDGSMTPKPTRIVIEAADVSRSG